MKRASKIILQGALSLRASVCVCQLPHMFVVGPSYNMFVVFHSVKTCFPPRSQAWDLAIPYEEHDRLIETIMQARVFEQFLRLFHLFVLIVTRRCLSFIHINCYMALLAHRFFRRTPSDPSRLFLSSVPTAF